MYVNGRSKTIYFWIAFVDSFFCNVFCNFAHESNKVHTILLFVGELPKETKKKKNIVFSKKTPCKIYIFILFKFLEYFFHVLLKKGRSKRFRNVNPSRKINDSKFLLRTLPKTFVHFVFRLLLRNGNRFTCIFYFSTKTALWPVPRHPGLRSERTVRKRTRGNVGFVEQSRA